MVNLSNMGEKLLCLMGKDIQDSRETVSNLFGPYLIDLLLKIWDIYEKCSKSVNFWARKMFFFFKWVRISPEIDWYHYQGASPAPTCIVRHQTMTKTSTRWSVTLEPSVPASAWNRVSPQRYISRDVRNTRADFQMVDVQLLSFNGHYKVLKN